MLRDDYIKTFQKAKGTGDLKPQAEANLIKSIQANIRASRRNTEGAIAYGALKDVFGVDIADRILRGAQGSTGNTSTDILRNLGIPEHEAAVKLGEVANLKKSGILPQDYADIGHLVRTIKAKGYRISDITTSLSIPTGIPIVTKVEAGTEPNQEVKPTTPKAPVKNEKTKLDQDLG